MNSELVLNWNKELGWKHNPFEDRIMAPIEWHFTGKTPEKDSVNIFLIQNQDLGIIRGKKGAGKTIMLKWIESQIKQHKGRIITNYVDYKKVNYEKDFMKMVAAPFLSGWETRIKKLHLKLNSSNISGFFTKRLKKKYLLLIDNLEGITLETGNVLSALKSHPNVQLIISANSAGLPDPELDLDLDELPFYDARILVERRIKSAGGTGIWPFSEQLLKEIFDEADYNPRKILKLCESRAISLSLLYKRGELQKPSEEQLLKQCLDKAQKKGFSITLGKKPELEEPEEAAAEADSEEFTYANEIKEEVLGRPLDIQEPEGFEPLKAFEVEAFEHKPKKRKK